MDAFLRFIMYVVAAFGITEVSIIAWALRRNQLNKR